MKQCPRCKEHKDASDYYRLLNGSNRCGPYCKPCQKEYCKAHYQRNKALHNQRRYANQRRYLCRNRALVTYLATHACVDCGEHDAVVLEFDHVTKEKFLEIAEMVSRAYSLQRIKFESQKCEVRCANCHRRKTARDFTWYKIGA